MSAAPLPWHDPGRDVLERYDAWRRRERPVKAKVWPMRYSQLMCEHGIALRLLVDMALEVQRMRAVNGCGAGDSENR